MALDFPNSPTNGQLYTSNNVTWEYDSSTSTWDVKYDGIAGTTRVALLTDQKNFGVDGGIFTQDAWRDRDLTVKEDPQNFVTFFPTTNGQTTPSPADTPGYWSLPAGTYRIDWSAPAFDVNRHKSRLVWSTTQSEISTAGLHANVVTAGDIAEGANADTTIGVTENVATQSSGFKIITIAETTYFKILHWAIVTRGDVSNPDGFGDGMSPGGSYDTGSEIYTQVRIEDLYTTVKDNATYVAGTSRIAFIEHREDSSVGDLGAFTQNVWATRKLNHTVDPQSLVSLDSGYEKFSLEAGTYRIKWSAPAVRCDRHQTKLVYASDASFTSPTQIDGSSEIIEDSDNLVGTRSFGETVLTFSVTTWFKIQQIMDGDSGNSSKGLETAGIFSAVTDPPTYSIYTQVSVEDLATAVKDNAIYVEGTSRVALLKDQKDTDQDAGSFENAVWRDRDLTVSEDPHNLVNFTVGGAQDGPSSSTTPGYWSVPAGTYRIDWSAPAHNVNQHQTLLAYSTTESHISTAGLDGSASYAEGSSEDVLSGGSGDSQTRSFGSKVIETTATTWFKIMHRCTTTAYGEGLGVAANCGVKEIYTQVRIEDLSTAVKDNATYVEGITKVATVKDVKAWNVNGGNANTSAWLTRDLNTISDPSNIGLSVSANVITVPPGTYSIKWSAPAWRVRMFTSKVEYSTDSTFATGVTSAQGSNTYASNTGSDGTESQTLTIGTLSSVTFTETTYVRIRQWNAVAKDPAEGATDNALGIQSSNSAAGDSIYTTVEIEDLATAVKDDGTSIVKQLVSGTTSTEVSHAYATYSSTGLTSNITLSNASNKVLVMVNQNVYAYDDDGQVTFAIKLVRTIGSTSTDIWLPGSDAPWTQDASSSECKLGMQATIIHVDAPGSTGPITYHTEAKGGDASCTSQSGNNYVSTIILQEVTS